MKPIILVVLLCAISFYFIKFVGTNHKSLIQNSIKTKSVSLIKK